MKGRTSSPLYNSGDRNSVEEFRGIPGTAYQIGNGPPGGTSEAAVRGEFVALGPPAWNASETLACDGPDLLRRARHPLCWWPQSGTLPPEPGGIRIGPPFPLRQFLRTRSHTLERPSHSGCMSGESPL